jgi:prephenate dehydratase
MPDRASDGVPDTASAPRTYSYLGPSGTFTEAALAQVPEARGHVWRSVGNVGEALDDLVSGRSDGAVIAIENSVEGGVTAAQDALARIPGVRIVGEYLVPVSFILVGRPGARLEDVRVVAAHPVHSPGETPLKGGVVPRIDALALGSASFSHRRPPVRCRGSRAASRGPR